MISKPRSQWRSLVTTMWFLAPAVSIETEELPVSLPSSSSWPQIYRVILQYLTAEARLPSTRNQCAQIGGSGQRNCIPSGATPLPV
jgi:hypothetical protein